MLCSHLPHPATTLGGLSSDAQVWNTEVWGGCDLRQQDTSSKVLCSLPVGRELRAGLLEGGGRDLWDWREVRGGSDLLLLLTLEVV